MANVYFKRGSQSALNILIQNVENQVSGASFAEGAFYLTNDTNRLYFAQASDKLVDLNQYIHIYTGNNLPTSTASAPLTEGDFYYWTNNNILCIYRNGGWTQINPDHALTPGQNSAIAVEAETNGATVGVTITDEKNTSATGDFTIVGGANVHVAVSGNTLTISADNDTTNTTYAIQTVQSNSTGQIKLHNTSNTSDPDSTVTLTGTGNVTVSSDANGNITIAGGQDITGISDEFDENGEYVIALARGQGQPLSTSGITPTIQYGVAQGEKENAVFVNGTAALDVYTKDEIDDLLDAQEAQLNAMKYAGTIASAADASTKLVSAPEYGVGTVYKAAADFTISSPAVTAKTGDLIIAGGTNDTAVTWEVVPSGDDQMISMQGSSAEKAVVFNDSLPGHAGLGSIVIDGGRKSNSAANAEIEVSASVSNSNKDTEFTIVHGAPGTGTAVTAAGTTSQVTGTTVTIPVITGISKDAQGHITAVTMQNYALTDTHAVLQDITTGVEVENNEATIGATFQLDSATAKSASFTIKSDNLKITDDNGDVIKSN